MITVRLKTELQQQQQWWWPQQWAFYAGSRAAARSPAPDFGAGAAHEVQRNKSAMSERVRGHVHAARK